MSYLPVSYLPGAAPLGDTEAELTENIRTKAYDENLLDVVEVTNPGSRQEASQRLEQDPMVVETEAKTYQQQGLQDPARIIEEGLMNRSDPQAVREQLEVLFNKQEALSRSRPSLEGHIVATLDEAINTDINFVSNRATMEAMLKQAHLESGAPVAGIAETAVDFADYYLAQMVGRTIEDLTNRTSRLGFTLADIARLPPEEVESAMQDYIDDIRKEGVLNNNSFAWEQALREFHSMGYNPNEDLEFAMGVFDVATSVTLVGASRVAGAARRSLVDKINRNPIGRYRKVANIKGPAVAGELVEKAAQQGDNEAVIQGSTDLVDIASVARPMPKVTGGSITIGGVRTPEAANAAGAEFNLSFKERLSRFTVKQVDDVLKRIPDAVLEEGLSEANLLRIERAMGVNNPTQEDINKFFAGRSDRAQYDGTQAVGGGVSTFRGTVGDAANADVAPKPSTFRERLSQFTVKEVEDALRRIPEADIEDGLSEANLRLIENALQRSSMDIDAFFKQGNIRGAGVTVGNVPAGPAANRGAAPMDVVQGGRTNVPAGMPTPANAVSAPTAGRVAAQVPVPTQTLPAPPAPPAVAIRGIRNNEFITIMEDRIKKLAAGQMFTADDISRISSEMATSWATRLNTPIFNLQQLDLKFHELGFKVQIGDSRGVPFADEAAAKAYADANLTKEAKARVEAAPVDALDPSKGYVLELTDKVPYSKADKDMDLTDRGVISTMIGRTFGSTSILDDIENYTNAYRAESASSAYLDAIKPLLNKVKGVNKASLEIIGDIMRELRDGVTASKKDHYTISEFEHEFMSRAGRLPTLKEIEAYETIVDLEVASWTFKASTKLNKFLEAGMESVTFRGQNYVAKKVSYESVAKDAGILDSFGNVRRKLNTTPSATPWKDDAIFQLMDPLENGITYISNPEKVRPLNYEDILPFNSGGRRTYADGRYFLVARKGADGVPAAKMTAMTQKQAETAAKEFNTILKASKAGHPNMDDIVKANNSWDPTVRTMADFDAFIKANKVDPDAEMLWKKDGGLLSPSDYAPNAARVTGLTWQERAAGAASRSDTVLPRFGGGKAKVEDPLDAVGKHFGTVQGQIQNTVAINKAVNGWAKALRQNPQSGVHVDQTALDSGDAFSMFRSAKFDRTLTKEGIRLKQLHDIINRRHQLVEAASMRRTIDQTLAKWGESILDSKWSDVKPVKMLGERIVDMGEPENVLLKLGFNTTFGFFALDQLVIQTAHGLTMAPLIAGDTKGVRALFGGVAVKTAIQARGTPAGDLAVKRLAKWIGSPEAEVRQLIDVIDISGRRSVGSDILELGWGAGNVVGRTTQKQGSVQAAAGSAYRGANTAMDASLAFYRMGEQASRLSTVTSAFYAYKKAFPLGDPLSEQGMSWIMKKEAAFSFHMTNTGRNAWQSGLMKFPTQWLSYPLRAAEAVFVGRDMTKMERARVTAAVFGIWGTAGVGADGLEDYLGEKFGFEPNGTLYHALRGGLLDGLMDAVGADLSFVDRLAPFSGLVDKVRSLNEDPFLETALGPSYGIATDGTTSFVSAISSFLNGRTEMAIQDLARAGRTIRTIDNAYKAADIYMHGHIMSKTGYKYQAEFSSLDMLVQAFGFSPREVSVINSKRTQKFRNDAEMRTLRKEYSRYMELAMRKISSDDREVRQRGYDLLGDIDTSIAALEGLSFNEQMSLRRGLLTAKEDSVLEAYKYEINRARQYSADAFIKETKGN